MTKRSLFATASNIIGRLPVGDHHIYIYIIFGITDVAVLPGGEDSSSSRHVPCFYGDIGRGALLQRYSYCIMDDLLSNTFSANV